ncbi:MAG: hypothetical protein WCC48_08825 [Anaeromyxobacteraceae bacterium]
MVALQRAPDHLALMASPWLLASSREDMTGAGIVSLYGRRFTIEETFRDLKNLRFGMGLTDTRISSPERRDRILLVGAIAASLLTLLGAAGESLGLDMKMKANTVRTRTHSLLNQGIFYFDCLLNMREERARPLMQRFDELLRQHAATREIFGSYEGMPQTLRLSANRTGSLHVLNTVRLTGIAPLFRVIQRDIHALLKASTKQEVSAARTFLRVIRCQKLVSRYRRMGHGGSRKYPIKNPTGPSACRRLNGAHSKDNEDVMRNVIGATLNGISKTLGYLHVGTYGIARFAGIVGHTTSDGIIRTPR